MFSIKNRATESQIQKQLDFELFYRNEPSAYSFIVMSSIAAVTRFGAVQNATLILGIAIASFVLSLVRIFLARAVSLNTEKFLPSGLRRFHVGLIVTNALLWSVLFGLSILENSHQSSYTFIVVLMALVCVFGSVTALSAARNLQILIMSLYGIPLSAILAYQVFTSALPPEDYLLSAICLGSYIFSFFQGRQACAYLIKRFEYEHTIDQDRKRLEKLVVELDQAKSELEFQTTVAVTASKLASMGEMAAGVAHEINNPLAIILAYVTRIKMLLAKGTPGHEQAIIDLLEKLAKTSFRIKKIVSSLKLLSRDTKNDPFEVSNLRPIVEETLGLCQQKFYDRGIALEVDPVPNIEIFCRPTQVSQVLLNLLSNAFDAISDNPAVPEKKISLRFEIKSGLLTVRVLDNGPGIAPEVLEKMFQPFFTTKKAGKGTGLGLSISRGIMEEHKGRIWSERLDGMTSFSLEFPLANQQSVKAAA